MSSNKLSTGTWVSIGEDCPVRVSVSGSDLAHVVIGDEDHGIELIFNAEGLCSLAEMSSKAVAEMDASSEQEAADHRQPAANDPNDVDMPEIGNPAS